MADGRRTPYTEIGVRRVKCFRCGKPAVYQWNICSDGGYRPICPSCDVKLNRLVLSFMKFPLKEIYKKMRRYEKKVRKANPGVSICS